ncbi:hypothetical protein [Amycolatopsis alkalitolerans]|uniref:Uncharacterized protein n=1 Tax=Amycolatopsis alkalitolerans TaxID=2547244 RepID=A0A5C4MAJ0_9PSEU|nr:hypothetical protein [Amycolatopsis alkalitolerans]TNC28500.1 hypothetical protein FG385_04270 [Amycolatopsis alkalitolerans]
MAMRDDMKNPAMLELLRAQRAQLAGRLETPWWYVAAMAFAWAVAFAMPIGSHYLTGAGIGGSLLVIVVFLLAQYALARVSGVNVGIVTWRYPSGRAWTIAIVMVIFAADAGETLLLEHRLLAAAIVVGGLATVVGTCCWQGHLRGIRRDLQTGRGAR